jgi:hypothetical protein
VDKKKTVVGKILQILSHFTWELPQQVVGVLSAEISNVLGGVDNVYKQNGACSLKIGISQLAKR